MAINIDDSFDIRNEGIAYRDEDGNALFYLATGSGVPTGSPAPINTFYVDQDTQLLYYKFGALDSDWRQLGAADIAIDDTALPFSAATVQEAIEKQAVSVGLPLTILGTETYTIPMNRQILIAELFINNGGQLILEQDSLMTVIS